jgi:hypothetical protein
VFAEWPGLEERKYRARESSWLGWKLFSECGECGGEEFGGAPKLRRRRPRRQKGNIEEARVRTAATSGRFVCVRKGATKDVRVAKNVRLVGEDGVRRVTSAANRRTGQ